MFIGSLMQGTSFVIQESDAEACWGFRHCPVQKPQIAASVLKNMYINVNDLVEVRIVKTKKGIYLPITATTLSRLNLGGTHSNKPICQMPWVRARNFRKGSRGNPRDVEVLKFTTKPAQHVGLEHVTRNFAQKLYFDPIRWHWKQCFANL